MISVNNINPLLIVFIGSGVGGTLRYLLSLLIPDKSFPLSTLITNIIACLVVGIVSQLILQKVLISDAYKQLIIIGFCGGLSTFSTFSAQSLSMLQNNQWISFIGHNSASIILCLLAIFLGQYLIKSLY
jgi:CrcB protein